MDDVDIRVRLRGGKVVQAEAQGVAAAIDNIGDQAGQASGKLAGLQAATSSLHGPLRGVGTATKYAALGLGALATASAGYVAFVGFKYNAVIDSQRVAFTTFFRDGKKAKSFMKQIQDLALQSPVLDPRTTGEAARLLMAYGVSVKDVLPFVKALGDMSAATGKSIEEVMPRAAMAIGQVASKGRLQAEELNQLAESVGLSRGRIRKALGMTKDEFNQSFLPGHSIEAKDALPAIMKAMTAQSKGAANRLSKTTSGQIARLQEVASRGFGQFTRGLWDQIGKGAGGLADRLQKINFRRLAHDIGDGLGKALAWVKNAWNDFMEALAPAKPFWDNVLGPLLKGIAIGIGVSIVGAVKVLVPAFKVLMIALGAVGSFLRPLRGFFLGLGVAIGFVFSGPILKAIGLLGKFGGLLKVVGYAAKLLSLPIRGLGIWFRFLFGMVFKALGALGGLAVKAIPVVRGAFIRVLSFVSGLGGKFFNAGKGLVSKLVDGIKGIGGAVVRAFGSGIGFAGDIGRALANWLNRTTPLGDKVNLPSPLPDFTIPALANGGIVTSGGVALVGERGPEVLRLGKGARVDPLPRFAAEMAGQSDGGGGESRIVLEVDGRTLTEVVHKHERNANNRR